MSKKIMIFNGSPRVNGNTEALIDAFIQGAEEAGNTVAKFNLREMNIHPCIGCIKGGKNPDSPCVQKDDMDKIYPVYKDADIFVLASPLYYWSFSAQMKTAFDRIFAVSEMNDGYKTPYKECMMLIAAEGTGDRNFAPMVDYYESLLKHLGWTDRGKVLAGGVLEVGDIKGHPAVEEARRLGASIV